MTDAITPTNRPDAVVIGAGPNGLAAAIRLAQEGRSVEVFEANETIGGGCRSAELTLPGFVHDTCAAIHALAPASPFFKTLPLEDHGLEWVHPPIDLAHPLDDGTAVAFTQSIEDTAESIGAGGAAWSRVYEPLVKDIDKLLPSLLGPFKIPRHPIALAKFGLPALLPADRFARIFFNEERARALFMGMAAHAMLDLRRPVSAAFGLVLPLVGHASGWPMAEGGSQRLVDALAAHLTSLGGTIHTGTRVTSLDGFDDAKAVLFDTTPRQFLDIAGDEVPATYRRTLNRYRHGNGVFKVDWALDGPVPWTAEECRRAGTVHLGGTAEEIVAAEHEVVTGKHAERPYVLVAQQSLFDTTRSPEGKHTLWAYCHVPNGSTVDMTDHIEAQIERFAPGFRDRIISRATKDTAELQAWDANFIGGDINGGIQDWRQLFTRPAPRLDPYSTPNQRLYFCSSSTPPGGGVHGMAGYHGAESALKGAFKD